MKKNLFIIIITILLLIVALVLILNNRTSTIRGEYSNFAIKDTASVTKIFLADKKNRKILLERKNNNEWTVNESYKARPDAVESILDALIRVDVKSPVSPAAHNNTVARLSSTGTKVEVYQMAHQVNIFDWIRLFPKEKLSKVFYVGGPTQENTGTYMLLENSTKPYVTYIKGFMGFLTPRYSTLLNDWRDHTIFSHSIPEIAEVRVEFFNKPELSYRINKVNTRFSVTELRNNKLIPDYDTLKLIQTLSYFRDVNFEALLEYPDEKTDSLITNKEYVELSLTDTSGQKKTLKTFRKDPPEGQVDLEGNPVPYDRDRLYGLMNEDEDFVLLQYFVFDNISRPLTYFAKPEQQLP